MQLETGYFASVNERYFAMDRIKHWDRTRIAWNAVMLGHPCAKLGIGRGLADVAPAVLDLLDIPKPQQMTGTNLLLKGSGLYLNPGKR